MQPPKRMGEIVDEFVVQCHEVRLVAMQFAPVVPMIAHNHVLAGAPASGALVPATPLTEKHQRFILPPRPLQGGGGKEAHYCGPRLLRFDNNSISGCGSAQG